MPLVAFMKQKDRNRISTITPNLEDRSQSRKLMVPAYSSDVYDHLYVVDCKSHIGGVTVPVELRDFVTGTGWVVRGIARCCPICWRVIVGVDGGREPVVAEQVFGDAEVVPPTPKKAPKQTKPQPVQVVDNSSFNFKTVLAWAGENGGHFDTYGVMEKFSVGRATAIALLTKMIKFKLLTKTVGAGRGSRTIYQIVEKSSLRG